MRCMRKHKRGFTLIEVSIFLAVTALLFLSVTIGVQNSIYQQRYTDAVQSFADFLGNLYAETTNVQSASSGRSDYAIYGKLAVFAKGGNGQDSEQAVYVYNTVGNALVGKSGSTLRLLSEAGLGVLVNVDEGSEIKSKTVGLTDRYVPRWGARIQTDGQNPQEDFSGMILVVRDPSTGTVRTFVNREEVSDEHAKDPYWVDGKIKEGGFLIGMQVDFCVNPNGNEFSNNRTDVRLASDASNASGVTIMPLDDNTNVCNNGGGA